MRNQKTATKKDEGLVEETSKSVKEEAKEERKEADETSAGSGERIRRQSTQETSDGSIEGEDVRSGGGQRSSGSRKDPRTERRIRNKVGPLIPGVPLQLKLTTQVLKHVPLRHSLWNQ